MAGTMSGQQFLKKYDESVVSSSKPMKELTRQPMKQLIEKRKELRYSKTLQKGNIERSSTSFLFDASAQLANIQVRITLYELLRLSRCTREALREELARLS